MCSADSHSSHLPPCPHVLILLSPGCANHARLWATAHTIFGLECFFPPLFPAQCPFPLEVHHLLQEGLSGFPGLAWVPLLRVSRSVNYSSTTAPVSSGATVCLRSCLPHQPGSNEVIAYLSLHLPCLEPRTEETLSEG